MKLMKKLFSIMTICFLLVLVVSCDVTHTHRYMDWTVTTEPTMDTEGVATRECSCGEKEEYTLPVLADTGFWTVSTEDATCQKEGTVTYTSEFGTVVIKNSVAEHEYTYVITKDPTMDTEGAATETCKYGETKEVTIPALTDEKVWTVKENADPTIENAGTRKYTSVYGDVEISVPALSNDEVWTVKETVDSTCSTKGSKTFTSIYGDVTIELAPEEHEYTYVITTDPTLDAKGAATATCKYGETITVDVPALTDEKVWTVKETVDSTCSKNGSKTFTSIYGDVTIELALEDHEYTYEIITDPTLDAKGVATATCKYGETTTVDVPVLSDATVWTKTVVEEATYNKGGKDSYTSVYGTVVLDTERLVAPYENKTYYIAYFDGRGSNGGYYFKALDAQTSYMGNGLSVNDEGKATSTSFPFSYDTQFEIVNKETGELKINFTSYTKNPYTGFIDMETGIAVIMNIWNERAPFLLIPMDTKPTTSDFRAMFGSSTWDKSIVINFTNGDTSRNIYVTDTTVYFGVTITDETGKTLAAKDAYKSNYVYIKNAENNVLGHFVNNGKTLVVSDNYEGTYQCVDNAIVISGCGTLTLNDVAGTYEVSENDDYSLGLYVNNVYYELTIAEFGNSLVKPMVEITFVTNGFEATEPVSVNKNTIYTLPVLGSETTTHIFKGWYLDEDFKTEAITTITPKTNVTVYAKWAEKVVLNLVGTLDANDNEVVLGSGDIVYSFLPKYTFDKVNMKKFDGWFADENYFYPINEEYSVSVDDSGSTLYAKWIDLPAYYGTYYGTELWDVEGGNSSKKTLTIDENGKISGVINGILVNYDADTQKIVWKTSETSTTQKTFYFDAETGIIAGIYRDNVIDTNYYFLSKDMTEDNYKVYAHLGLYAPMNPETDVIAGEYAQFVEVTSGNIVFLYNNYIYSNVTLETVDGTAINSIAELKAAKTVKVKENGVQIIALGTTQSKFGDTQKTYVSGTNVYYTKPLDDYLGTYTSTTDENTVVLDGVGGITYGSKTGTYKASGISAYGFDVYLENSSEYYRLTLNENIYTIEKPMVTYHFITGDGHPVVEDVEYNVNITVTTLPTIEHDGFAFKGWYTTDTYETVVTNFTPTEETTLYAKWNEIFTVIVYLGENEIESKKLEDGEYFVPTPSTTDDGKLIVGYYLDSIFENEYDSTLPITESMNIYAKSMLVAPEGVLSMVSNGGKDKIIVTNVYAWNITVNEDGTINLTSTNAGVGSSESQFVVTFAKDSIVTFNYDVSSEGSSYDNLYVMIKENDKSTFTENAKYGSKDGITGTYTHTFHTGDTLALLYKKDGGGNNGRDNAIITNLSFTNGLPDAQLTYVYNDGETANTTGTVSLGGYLTEELLSTPENVRDENSYRFAGWYVDASFTTKATTSYTVTTENLTLYAKWDEKVTVSFVVPEGATTVEDMSVWTNEAFDITTTLLDGYIFRGWYTSSDYTDTTKYDLTKGVTETTTLYAKFEEMPVGSSFDKAKEVVVDFTNNVIKLENTVTTEDFQVYYIKLVVNAAGKYILNADNAKKSGGNGGYSYPAPKIALYEDDMETLVALNNKYNSYDVILASGTYYMLIHIYADPSKTISSSDTCWGTIGNITIETFAHDEVTEAVDYVLGNTVTIDTITSRDDKYILKFTATTSKTYQFDFSTTKSSISVALYSDSALETEMFSTGYGTSKSEIVTLQENVTYYLVISNNWSTLGTVTISSSEFSIRDVIATKVFSGDYKFYCGSSNWTATTTFTFDNNGNAVISSSSSDHDDWYSGCYKDYYSPSFTGSYTYTLDGATLTLTKGTTILVFTLDNADAPTKMTLSSTTLSESSQGYFAVGTVFNLK